MLLYGQLQEGFLYTLVEYPSVFGAQNYRELYLAAKREEQRLAGLKKKQEDSTTNKWWLCQQANCYKPEEKLQDRKPILLT